MLLSLLAAFLLAQTPPATKVDPNAPITMNGCLTRDYTDSKSPSAYLFEDSTDGSRYHVKGRNLSKYSGMSVQVVGTIDRRRLRFVGGLYPSPNAAAQAGAADPGKAAIAAMPGGAATGTGNVELPTLTVT